MAGAVVTVGIVACAATLTVGLVVAGGASAFSQRMSGTADNAALAAADAASGAATGAPCERAEAVAAAGGFALERCELEGLIATVSVTGEFAGFRATTRARAGPP